MSARAALYPEPSCFPVKKAVTKAEYDNVNRSNMKIKSLLGAETASKADTIHKMQDCVRFLAKKPQRPWGRMCKW